VKQHIFENGHYLYMVGPVAPFTPESAEVEAYAHAEDLRKSAPNENLMWPTTRTATATSGPPTS
jgi:hypothetical protein